MKWTWLYLLLLLPRVAFGGPSIFAIIDLGTGFLAPTSLNAFISFDSDTGELSISPSAQSNEGGEYATPAAFVPLGVLPAGEIPQTVFGRRVVTFSRQPPIVVICYEVLTLETSGTFRLRELRYTMESNHREAVHGEGGVSVGSGHVSLQEAPFKLEAIVRDLRLNPGDVILGASQLDVDAQKVAIFVGPRSLLRPDTAALVSLKYLLLERKDGAKEYVVRSHSTLTGPTPTQFEGPSFILRDGVPLIALGQRSKGGTRLTGFLRLVPAGGAVNYQWHLYDANKEDFMVLHDFPVPIGSPAPTDASAHQGLRERFKDVCGIPFTLLAAPPT